MNQDFIIRRLKLLDGLERLGDGLNAWYVTPADLAAEVGVGANRARVDLSYLEIAGLVERNFKRPLQFRIRPQGEEVVGTMRTVIANVNEGLAQIDALVSGYLAGALDGES